MKRELPEGSVVKFQHMRRYSRALPLAKGGLTECRVILPNGEEVFGAARCRNTENYSKRLGRNISLGRALAHAAKDHPDLFKVEEKA